MHVVLQALLLLVICPKLLAEEFRWISFQSHPKMGVFACANKVLGHIALYDTGEYASLAGLGVDFGMGGLYFDPAHGPNWWEYYFNPIVLGDPQNTAARNFSRGEDNGAVIKRKNLTRVEAARLVKKYVSVKRSILDKVDQFVTSHFQDFFVIGVHYRGTDKGKEAPRVSYHEVFEKIRELIPLNDPYKIFVATDEVCFLEECRELFSDRIVAIDACRSEGKDPVHFSNDAPYQVGEEAVVDALLLSKCSVLIRTSSNLSLWSTYFSPEIPVTLLNRRIMKTLEPE